MTNDGAIKRMIVLQDIAAALCISVRNVWRLVARGELPKPVKIGRSARWFETDLAEYQEKLRNSR